MSDSLVNTMRKFAAKDTCELKSHLKNKGVQKIMNDILSKIRIDIKTYNTYYSHFIETQTFGWVVMQWNAYIFMFYLMFDRQDQFVYWGTASSLAANDKQSNTKEIQAITSNGR